VLFPSLRIGVKRNYVNKKMPFCLSVFLFIYKAQALFYMNKTATRQEDTTKYNMLVLSELQKYVNIGISEAIQKKIY
jgi:hypothetical protein